MQLFEHACIGGVKLPNRIIRSATFEGMAAADGSPLMEYRRLYDTLAARGIGAIITGFAFVNVHGKAMQPGQAGIEKDDKIPRFTEVTESVHQYGGRIFLQIAHTGRQTVPQATGGVVWGPGTRASSYFRVRPQRLPVAEIETIIEDFGQAARRSREAGFDGVQVHAAHGYLIHQFINPAVNDRTDAFGIDPVTGIETEFLRRIIARIRSLCGQEYPLLVKISAGDEYRRGIRQPAFVNIVRFLDTQAVDAIEISWGTMDQAFNIFRGNEIPVQAILDYNPRHRHSNRIVRAVWKLGALPVLRKNLMVFSPAYNLSYARLAKENTTIPIISVGGFRTGTEAAEAVEKGRSDFVSMCRPLIREPELVERWRTDLAYRSRCVNCNRCAVMCDSGQPTRCYMQKA
jgi:2,4-dienoyl-CoA reductase-like NADH-dependent reductase (Old Yellow Enzyme family)